MTLFCLASLLLYDLLNVCRNISDGVRPFIPPCSIVSLYDLTNISHILFFHHMDWLCLQQWKEIHFWQSCYMMLLPYLVIVDKNLELAYPSFMSLRSRKCLNILDINCFLLLSCIWFSLVFHWSLLSIFFQYIKDIRVLLFLSDHLLATFLEQSSIYNLLWCRVSLIWAVVQIERSS